MTPGARVQAAIDILEAIAAGGRGPGRTGLGSAPADATANGYFRSRRYIGSKDRIAISTLVYAVLRRRSQLDWWIGFVREGNQRGAFAPNPRQRVIAALGILENWPGEEIERSFDGSKFRPDQLSPVERTQAYALSGRTIDHPEQPDAVRYNCPDWLLPSLRERFGRDYREELKALNEPAELDLRVNVLKGTRQQAEQSLYRSGVKTHHSALSPHGLRVEGRPNLPVTEAFKDGLVEIQDEGSQLAALLVGAEPGMRVCDFCAGAAGKTLAIAASMGNRGHIVACDVSGPRLEAAGKRLRRAGVHNVERRQLESERDGWVKKQAGKFDRVLIDAPCSGTGTWRRNPDARWLLTPQDIQELRQVQVQILASAARLVKPGGRLIYVTCSVLPEENDRQAEAFAAVQPEFALVAMPRVWKQALGTDCPSEGPYLRLSPGQHGTDGFFVAVFERATVPEKGSTDEAAADPSGDTGPGPAEPDTGEGGSGRS